jgi:hypothetical protein
MGTTIMESFDGRLGVAIVGFFGLSDGKPGGINVRKGDGVGILLILVGSIIVSFGHEKLNPRGIVFFEAVDG